MRNILNEGQGVSVVLPFGHTFGGKPGDGSFGNVMVFERSFELGDEIRERSHGYGCSSDGILSKRGCPSEGRPFGHVGEGKGNHFVIGVVDFMLQLGTPNSVLTDLVVFLFFLYLIRLTYNTHTVSYASLFISHPCLMHSSLHSSPCSAWLCPSLLLFHSATAVRLPHALLPFHFMAVLDARFYLMLLDTEIF